MAGMRTKIITLTIVLASFLGMGVFFVRAQTQNSTPSTGLAISPPTFEVNGNA